MAINAKDFTFCNKKLSDFGFIIANFDSSSDDDVSCGNIEVVTERPPMSDKNIIHGVSYGEPIKLTFQIVKFDFVTCMCSSEPVTNDEYDNLMRWLVKPTYNYIYFDDDVIYFNVTMSVVAKKIGGVIRGFEITATNDSIYSYTPLIETPLQSGSWTFNDNSKVIGYTYPNLTITAVADGDVTIEHTNDRKVVISNCIAGEVIKMDCEHKIITSSNASHNLSSDFNFVFFRFFNTEETKENTVNITNATVLMRFRYKRAVMI